VLDNLLLLPLDPHTIHVDLEISTLYSGPVPGTVDHRN
jgi:hypothetical protein